MICYLVVRDQLRGQVDNSLRAQETVALQSHGISRSLPGIPASAGGPAPYVQFVLANGQSGPSDGDVALPVTTHTRVVAKGQGGSFLTDVHVGGTHLRVITFHASL